MGTPVVSVTMTAMRDIEIREALIRWIRGQHSDPASDRIWSEFALCIGAARVDVCLVNGALSGYEIKSPRDNLDRLPTQVDHYGRVLDFATIVTTSKHLPKVRSAVPSWWGIIEVRSNAGTIEFIVRRKGRRNVRTDPFSVAQLLWRDEAYRELEHRGVHSGLSRGTRWDIWDRLVATLSSNELSEVVRTQLKARPPREADVRLDLDVVR